MGLGIDSSGGSPTELQHSSAAVLPVSCYLIAAAVPHGVAHGRYAGSAQMTETTALPFTPHPWQRSECLRSSTEVCGGSPSPAAAIRPTRLQEPHSTLMRSAGPRSSSFAA